MYESWQVIPQGHCLFDSSTLPPTAPLIMVFMYFGSTKQSKMAKLTIEAVDRGSHRNGTNSSPKKKKKINSIHFGVNHTYSRSFFLIMSHLKKKDKLHVFLWGGYYMMWVSAVCVPACFHPYTAEAIAPRLQGKFLLPLKCQKIKWSNMN